MKATFLSQRSLAVVLTTVLLLVSIPVTSVFAASSGPSYAQTGASLNGPGTVVWTNPDRLDVNDNSYATAVVASSGAGNVTTDYLRASNFGFAIPADATVDGITVEIGRFSTGTQAPFIQDVEVKLVNGSAAIVGDNKANTAADWPTAEGNATYGGAADKWNAGLTAADINDTDFGVVLSVRNANTQNNRDRTATVDYIRVTVSYTTPQTPTLSVTNSPVTYDGTQKSATVVGSVPGTVSDVKYDGSSTVPTNAGAYAITADFLPADTITYTSLADAPAGNFVINKATPTATLAVNNSPVTYTGTGQSATVGITASSVPGSVSNILTGGAATQTDANTYAVTANFVPTDSANYNSLTGLSAGDFVINKATPTASITNSPVIYNGSAQTATVACSGGGAATLASGGTGTNAGSYPAMVDCAASTNYNAALGLAAGDFVINPSNQTITFGALGNKFVGDADFAVSATTSSGLAVNFSSTTPGVCTATADGTVVHLVSAGTCTIQASQAGNTNYNAATPVDQSFTVHPAGSLVLTITGITANNKVYDGNASATLNVGSAALTGVVSGHDVQLDTTAAAGAFADKNVGTGKTVTISGLTLTGADAGKYSFAQPTATADITPKDLTVTAAGVNKAYDGTTAATVTLSSDALGSDVVTLTYASAAFADSNVGNGKAVSVSGIALGGVDAGNYNLLNTTASTTANITLTITHIADTTGVFRPINGIIFLKNTNVTGFADIALNYGIPGDYPVVGDWDGSGTATIGIYRNGSFYLRNSNTVGFADWVFPFGQPGDQPVAGDWDGDGIDTIGIYRPSTGQFQLRNSNSAGPADMTFYLGNVGDVGIAGDWDGDGKDTTGVFRPVNGIIFLKNTNTTGFADVALNYGIPGDKPVIGDWDADGIDTIGVYRNGVFLLRNSNTVGFADIVFGLGNPGDMPIAGDWDALP